MTAYSPVLAIPQVAASQNNKYITINDLEALSEGAANKLLDSNTTGPLTLTEAQFTRYQVFKARGRAGAFNITLPLAVQVTTVERVFVVWNADTTYTATLQQVSSAGATVTLAPGQVALCYRNGADVYALILTSAGGISLIYDIGFFIPGKPGAAAISLIFKTPRAFTIAGNAVGSTGSVGTNPTSSAAFDIQKNGSSVGSITFNTSGVATFATTSGLAVSFAINDILKIVAPGSQDATMADIGVVFLGTR